MAEGTPGKSRYALKLRGVITPSPQRRPEWKRKRICSGCRGRLAGKNGHGFPSANGRGVYCGGCRFDR